MTRATMVLTVCALLAPPVLPFVVSAQSPVSVPTPDCMSSLPPSVFTVLPVLLDARAADSASLAILPAADILTQTLAEEIRATIATTPSEQLPPADSVITWNELSGEVLVTVHRDGHFSWQRFTFSPPPRTTDTKAIVLLERVLKKTADSGERLFWPETARGDSHSFALNFVQPVMRADGKVEPAAVRIPVPVFTLRTPWKKALVQLREPDIGYPEAPRVGIAEGRVILEFVVDTTGRIDMETVREKWPTGRPRQGGALGEYYRAFLAAVKRGLSSARFSPALVGGCVSRQLAQQVFEFKLDR